MSDQPISGLPEITTLGSGDLFPVVQSDVTSKINYDNFLVSLNSQYLKLSGGTMTGPLVIEESIPIKMGLWDILGIGAQMDLIVDEVEAIWNVVTLGTVRATSITESGVSEFTAVDGILGNVAMEYVASIKSANDIGTEPLLKYRIYSDLLQDIGVRPLFGVYNNSTQKFLVGNKGDIKISETTTPTDSLSDEVQIYAKEDIDTNTKLFYRQSNGTEVGPLGVGGSSSPLTTKGDLFGFDTTNNRIPVGTNGQVLTADSVSPIGVSWQSTSGGGITSLAGDTAAIQTFTAGNGIDIVNNSPDHLFAINNTVVTRNAVNTYVAGVTQNFVPNNITVGLNIGSFAGNPSVLNDGDVWLNSTTNQLFGRINGVNVDLGVSGELNTISSLGGGIPITATIPKVGVDLQTISIATTNPITSNSVADLLTFSLNPITDVDISNIAEISVSKLQDGNPGQFLRTDVTGNDVQWTDDIFTINYVIDGGGFAISPGIKGNVIVDFDCEVIEWAIVGLPIGDIVVDVSSSTFAAFPVVSSIAGTELPTITATDKGEDRSITTWDNIVSGDILQFNVTSVNTIQRCTVALKCRKTG